MPLNDAQQNLKPEERARVKIDEQLVEAGWYICDRNHYTDDHNLSANVALFKQLHKGIDE